MNKNKCWQHCDVSTPLRGANGIVSLDVDQIFGQLNVLSGETERDRSAQTVSSIEFVCVCACICFGDTILDHLWRSNRIINGRFSRRLGSPTGYLKQMRCIVSVGFYCSQYPTENTIWFFSDNKTAIVGSSLRFQSVINLSHKSETDGKQLDKIRKKTGKQAPR